MDENHIILKQILEQISNVHVGSGKRDANVERLADAVTTLNLDFKDHTKNEESVMKANGETQKEIAATLVDIRRGFPKHPKSGERDPVYHADKHEDEDDAKKVRKELLWKIVIPVVVATFMLILGGIGTMMLTGAKVEVKRALTEQSR